MRPSESARAAISAAPRRLKSGEPFTSHELVRLGNETAGWEAGDCGSPIGLLVEQLVREAEAKGWLAKSTRGLRN